MRIERLEPSRRKKGRILAFLEDGSILKLTERELLAHGLRAGDELSEEQIAQLQRSFGESNAKAEGAAMLGRRAMSRADVEKKLREKGASERESSYAVEWLDAIGALDDAAYAAMLVRHYSARGYGAARWREELRRHGIERELWEEAMEAAPESGEIIAQFLRSRRYGQHSDEKETKRMTDALLRRGFSWSEIKSAMREYTDLPEEDESSFDGILQREE